MMTRRLLAAAAFTLLATASAIAAPALWKVSDADSAVWLFGSIHLLPADTEWRTPEFEAVLAGAERVYFETDLGPNAQPEIAVLTIQKGFVTDGRLLSDRIEPELLAKVREAAALYDVPMASLLAMRPWLAASTLSVSALTQAGYDPNKGVDSVLQDEIPKDRQGFLETAAEQIDFLAGSDEASEVQMLEGTLAEADRMVEMTEEMKAAWLDGNPEILGDVFMAEAGGYGDAFIETLINQRNHNWVVKIETMLTGNEDALIVVGAGHLIGEKSLAKLLENKGFLIERVQ